MRNSLAFYSGNSKERGHLVVEGLDGRIGLKETGYDCMECIRLGQSRDQWRILVITKMALHVRQKSQTFPHHLSGCWRLEERSASQIRFLSWE